MKPKLKKSLIGLFVIFISLCNFVETQKGIIDLKNIITKYKDNIVTDKYFFTNLIALFYSGSIDVDDTDLTFCIFDKIKEKESQLIITLLKNILLEVIYWFQPEENQCKLDEIKLDKFYPQYMTFKEKVDEITENAEIKCKSMLYKNDKGVNSLQRNTTDKYPWKNTSYLMSIYSIFYVIQNSVSFAFSSIYSSDQSTINQNFYEYMVINTKEKIEMRKQIKKLQETLSYLFKKIEGIENKYQNTNILEDKNYSEKEIEYLEKLNNITININEAELIFNTEELMKKEKENIKVRIFLTIGYSIGIMATIFAAYAYFNKEDKKNKDRNKNKNKKLKEEKEKKNLKLIVESPVNFELLKNSDGIN